MFITFIFTLALLGGTVAKLDKVHPSTMEIGSLASTVNADGEPVNFSGAVVIDGVSQANHLSMDCNNKFCNMWYYASTCKAIGLDIKKICSLHLLGYKYGCDAFPPPPDVVNAPSICIPSVLKVLQPITTNPTVALKALLGPYLNASTFQEHTCGRNCFQNYQYASHDFYSTCTPEVNATYVKLAALTSIFQEYRNQACSLNPKGENCYATVMKLVPSPSAARTAAPEIFGDLLEAAEVAPEEEALRTEAVRIARSSVYATEEVSEVTEAVSVGASIELESSEVSLMAAPAPNIFSFTCDYGYGYDINQMVKGGVCAKLAPMQCCAATGITMLAQNPISSLGAIAAGGSPDAVIFPPCLLKYMNDACPALDLTNYCTNGSIASTTVFKGTLFIPRLTTPPTASNIPNVYVKASTLQIQGGIQLALANVFPIVKQYPYSFTNALPVQVMDYTYYNSVGAPLSPNNGSQHTPYGSDWTMAAAGNFTYQIVLQNLDAASAATFDGYLKAPQFQAALNAVFLGSSSLTYVKTKTAMAPEVFDPIPLAQHSNSAAHTGAHWLMAVCATLAASALLGAAW